MERRHRQAPAQVLYQQARSPTARGRKEEPCPPKTQGAASSIAAILSAELPEWKRRRSDNAHAARFLISAAGSSQPGQLSTGEVLQAAHYYQTGGYQHSTQVNLSCALRRVLLFLWEYHGAPKLDAAVPHLAGVRPRNVTATRDEIEAIYGAATPSLRLWLMLCSDLGIRSGTAARLGPQHYDAVNAQLQFTTKYHSTQTLPLTAELCATIELCDMSTSESFVWQLRRKEATRNYHHYTTGHITGLHRELRRILKTLAIPKRIIPHDLRRTTAVEFYKITRDLRAV